MAPRVTFYDGPPEHRLRRVTSLASAAWERGRKLLVHCGSVRDAQALDELLWTAREESFIPHELVRPDQAPRDVEARVVLVIGEYDPIGADVLVQEAPTSFEFAERFEFVIDLVDHRDPELLGSSRQRYKDWRARGANPDYRKT